MFVLPRKWCFQSIISDMLAGRKGPYVTGRKKWSFLPLFPPCNIPSIALLNCRVSKQHACLGLKCHLTTIHKISALRKSRLALSRYVCSYWSHCSHFYRGSPRSVQSPLSWPAPLNPQKAIRPPKYKDGGK